MKFHLECVEDGTGRPRQFVFDNMDHCVVDESGRVLEFKELFGRDLPARLNRHESTLAVASETKDAKERLCISLAENRPPTAFPFSRHNPLQGKSRRISKLKIQLGFACNYRCRYCLQAADRNRQEAQPNIDDINRFFEMFDAAGAAPHPDGLIDLWGGEPLVYGKLLKVLIPMLREHWGEKTVISLFTNGVLLDRSMSDFLLEHCVKVSISHDGTGFALRHPQDPLDNEEIRAQWLYLFEKSREKEIPMAFFSVINPLNCDLFEQRQFFWERFAQDVSFAFGGAAAEFGNLPSDCLLGEKAANTLRDSVLRAVVTEPGLWPGIERRILNLLGRFVHHTPSSQISYHCNAADPRVLCVNLKGDVLSCQNRAAPDFSIGHLTQYESISNKLFSHWSVRPQCPQCLVLGACKGGCPDLTDAQQARCCTNDFAFHYAFFYAVWYLLTGTFIQKPTPSFPIFSFDKRLSIYAR